MVFPPLTFMVDPNMNLMSGPHHECERREHHSLCSESTEELLVRERGSKGGNNNKL